MQLWSFFFNLSLFQTHFSISGLKGDGNLYTSLPPNKREEVEKLLNGSTEETWRHLAGELGYKEDHIDSFTQEEYPVRALLSDWSSKDSSTMDALYSALRKIQRGDIVESLYSESTASSPVWRREKGQQHSELAPHFPYPTGASWKKNMWRKNRAHSFWGHWNNPVNIDLVIFPPSALLSWYFHSIALASNRQ